MSEYQYYEFRAIDQPLDEKAIQALRELSSRAQITPTSFVNEYNWGDFKGSPMKLMEKYFDAFLYVANWGTHEFMLKVPLKLINFDLIKEYCYGENVTAYKKGENLIFEFISETDDHEWEEGEDWLSSLITLRSDILHGDYRCLYLGWLFCAQMGDFEDDGFEPSVPANFGNLNGPLKSFVDFMRIDADLVAVAAENSASKELHQAIDQKALSGWISNLPEKEKDDALLRLIKDHDPHLTAELVQRYQQTVSIKDTDGADMKPRTVAYLISKGERHTAERKRRIAEQAAKEKAQKEREKAVIREKYLNELAKRGDQVWKQVDEFIKTKQQADYDEAVRLLVDLRDIDKRNGNETAFKRKLEDIREKHRRKPSFVRRLSEAGLG
ncbi:MAG: hypothetical protein KJ573_01065 [Proteobacteria bacterium]|nr:hypothetical protein [Pseudomonadota bacterium]MBU1902163.1 hypothetical protein [Pseudomonadota bacterium]